MRQILSSSPITTWVVTAKSNSLPAPLTDAVVSLSDSSVNAFSIAGVVREAILNSNRPYLADDFTAEAASTNYYGHLLRTCFKYVHVLQEGTGSSTP